MISFNGLLLVILFLILTIGFFDIFVKIPYENRCEMTYMYQVPQYVDINLDQNLKKSYPNYNLYVYGEGEYADSLRLNEFSGNPVLFVPGNGGSYRQVRSLASVSLVMSYTSGRIPFFNYFTVDYNEELSAFIGNKLESQTKYLYHSIKKIVELYEQVPNTKIILIGHSIGGILIKALFSKPYFKPYLPHIAVVFTLATPHTYPAIPFDMKILNFYYQTNLLFYRDRHLDFGHINFVSIGGSSNDKLIRSDLIDMNSQYKFDRSMLTTAIDDVWASADHLCIVWCRQLMIKLNQIFFDLTSDDFVLLSSPEHRQDIIDFHLKKRSFKGTYPTYIVPENITYLTQTEWIEHKTRLARFNMTKVTKSTYHLVPFYERETIVLHIEGALKTDTISACKAMLIEDRLLCVENGLNLYNLAQLIPTKTKSIDRHMFNLNSNAYLQMAFTHLVISITPTQSSYSVLIDRFTTSIRHKSINLPNLLSIAQGGFLKPKLMFTKLISQEQSFFNLTFDNLDSIWQTYYVQVQTKTCYHAISSFVGYSYLTQDKPELNEYYWPFMPGKGASLQFTLKLMRPLGKFRQRAAFQLHLEPNCGYEVLVKFSLIDSSAQFVKHYFTLLVPIIISTAILVLSVHLSNLLLLYSFSTKELDKLDKFKTALDHDLPDNIIVNKKCFVYMSTSQVMTNWRYFFYSYAQIVLYSIFSLLFLKKFYPTHDLSNLIDFPGHYLFALCSALFLFAYSLVYVFTNVVHFLANNFALGIIYVYLRLTLFSINLPFTKTISTCRWNRAFACFTTSTFIIAYIFFIQSVFYLVHMCFTVLMLVRFIKLNFVEMRIGRTTYSSFVRALYPVIYSLQFALAVLQIPQSIDSVNSVVLGGQYTSLTQIIASLLPPWQQSIQALICISFYLFLHMKQLNFGTRITTLTNQISQKRINVGLILLAFCNIMIGSLAFEFITYSVLATFIVISVAVSVLDKQITAKEELKID